MKFVNRKEELRILEEEYKKDRASFVVIYGRRRVGKTRLIEEFVKDKEYVYYLAADEREELQIREFKEILAEYLKDAVLRSIEIKDWKTLFSYLERAWPKKRKIVMVIDEFTYLIKQNPAIVSYLQRFWDKFLSKTKTMLIICGSLVKIMIEKVLEEPSPLYGRRTAEIFVEKFGIKEVMEFLDVGLKDAIKFYAILDGIPKYLELVDTKNFEEFVFKILNKRSVFYREGYYLMAEELKEISTYINILRAIGEGNTKISEIANYSGIEAKKLYPYLEILENLGFIKSLKPLFYGNKKTIFLISDNFLCFWFKFMHKYRAWIEMDRIDKIKQKIINELNMHVARIFEDVCMQILPKIMKINFTKIGKQWGKIPRTKETYEIDIVALNEQTKEILFAECKWQSNVNALKICKELANKASYVDWHNERKGYFAIFAKSFSKKIDEYKGRKVFCYDLRDLENLIKL